MSLLFVVVVVFIDVLVVVVVVVVVVDVVVVVVVLFCFVLFCFVVNIPLELKCYTDPLSYASRTKLQLLCQAPQP